MAFNTKKVIFILSGILFMIACVSLHAVEAGKGVIYYKNTLIKGKEYLYVGKEYLVAKKNNTRQIFAQNNTKTESKTAKAAKNNIVKKETPVTVFPVFPFIPSSSSYSYWGGKSILISKQDSNQYPSESKKRGNPYSCNENSSLSLHSPEQRQKLSIAAIQCGILTSFSPNSPSLV